MDASEEMQQLALVGGYVDGGESSVGVCAKSLFESWVGWEEMRDDVGVDVGPEFIAHAERVAEDEREQQVGLVRPIGIA